MRFTAIDSSAWEELKKSIEELALCMREHFDTKSDLPDLLHNGDVCRILNISKRTLQHYRDTSVLPFIQIGHKCYYKREDVKALLEKSNHQQGNARDETTHLRHQRSGQTPSGDSPNAPSAIRWRNLPHGARGL